MHEVGVVVALSSNGGVLVLSEPREVERRAVDEELGAAHLDGAHADRQRVGVDHLVVFYELDHSS